MKFIVDLSFTEEISVEHDGKDAQRIMGMSDQK